MREIVIKAFIPRAEVVRRKGTREGGTRYIRSGKDRTATNKSRLQFAMEWVSPHGYEGSDILEPTVRVSQLAACVAEWPDGANSRLEETYLQGWASAIFSFMVSVLKDLQGTNQNGHKASSIPQETKPYIECIERDRKPWIRE